MTSKDAPLYGVPRPKKVKPSGEMSASTLAFSSTLSSLIATSSSAKPTTAGRQRPRKEDIFTKHNKNSRKRALKDLEDADSPSFSQKHTTRGDDVDDAVWRRAQRKMEEKARLYAAMKRGDVADDDERHMVDFDRKWAEAQDGDDNAAGSSSEDGGSGDESGEELVEYEDEFGRLRKGTKGQAARELRRRHLLLEDQDRMVGRPQAPQNVIYGDTIQSAAFNPDEPVAAQMAELSAKRDKEATPPPDEHFDGRKEVRTKGVGFFQFSGDSETRRAEMEGLDAERQETERRRAEINRRKVDRRKEVEERRRAIREKRSKGQADRFLSGLGEEWAQRGQEDSPEEREDKE